MLQALAAIIHVLEGQQVFKTPAAGDVAMIAQCITMAFLYFA